MKLTFVDEVRVWYKMYSVWFFAILGILPDLYNLAVDNHLLDGGNAPAFLARAINVIAFAGAASRLVKQAVVSKEAEKQASIRLERESQLAADAADQPVKAQGGGGLNPDPGGETPPPPPV